MPTKTQSGILGWRSADPKPLIGWTFAGAVVGMFIAGMIYASNQQRSTMDKFMSECQVDLKHYQCQFLWKVMQQ